MGVHGSAVVVVGRGEGERVNTRGRSFGVRGWIVVRKGGGMWWDYFVGGGVISVCLFLSGGCYG